MKVVINTNVTNQDHVRVIFVKNTTTD